MYVNKNNICRIFAKKYKMCEINKIGKPLKNKGLKNEKNYCTTWKFLNLDITNPYGIRLKWCFCSSFAAKLGGNVNNLSGCADYGIPRTFRDYGILKYSSELEETIDNEKEVLHDSEMEIEIRANMLYVIELIKEKSKNKDILFNSAHLDNLIWWMGKKNKNRKSIAHHTITIFY